MPISPNPRFSAQTFSFLKALERHNDREWFRARKAAYEQHVRGPMVAVIERLAIDLARFAPDLVASPRVSLYRPYRDTRFSGDKRPLKTNVSALFPRRDMPKHAGAGLYLEVSTRHTFIGGGLYAPEPAAVYRLREHIAANHRRLRTLVESAAFVRTFGGLQGDALVRVPRGFPADHPAAEYLKLRQYLMAVEYPAAFAASPRFYSSLVRMFEQMAPVIRFLNEPLLAAAGLAAPSTARSTRHRT